MGMLNVIKNGLAKCFSRHCVSEKLKLLEGEKKRMRKITLKKRAFSLLMRKV